ncbi:hypothetical protein [Variovorax sp. YR216]|uniref:hypothetical protein n=1 Tax=Variovorax sp. YR216 TaxID=1882828 RepID=UPI000895FA6B|nr:hypothetical protein [Variovorax sp. YR216]SEB03689.1 hypothetical protein SAMN05444680_10614 [Variovorax sp. YR216]
MNTNTNTKGAGLAAFLLMSLAVLCACGDNEQVRFPNRDNFTATVNDFLAQRGHVCLAKYDWPIAVATGSLSADAQQMPVLEKIGLVSGRDIVRRDASGNDDTAREYSLTAEGRKFYRHEPVVIRTATRNVVHPADFCVASLTLDRLLGWEAPQTRDGRTGTSLLFTYRIAPEPWAAAPEVLRAFPLLAHAIQNEKTMQVRLGVHLTPHGWVADELDEH